MTGPSFRFRLERVRALRERGEDLAKQALAGALAQQLSGEEQLRAADERLSQAREAQREAAASECSASDLVARQAYLERVERDHDLSARDLDRRSEEVDLRRDDLRHAARERQALERLKERRRNDHQRQLARSEGQAQDEIALSRFRGSNA